MSKKFLKKTVILPIFLFFIASCKEEMPIYDFVSIGNVSIILKNEKIDTFLVSIQDQYDYYSFFNNHLDTFTTYYAIEPTIRKDTFLAGFFECTREAKFLEYYYNEKLKVTYDQVMNDTALYNDLINNFKEQLNNMTQYRLNHIHVYNDTSQLSDYVRILNLYRNGFYKNKYSDFVHNKKLTEGYVDFLDERSETQYRKILNLYVNNEIDTCNILFNSSRIPCLGYPNDIYMVLRIKKNGSKLVLENEIINPELYNSKYFKYSLCWLVDDGGY